MWRTSREREQIEDWVVDLVRSGIGTFNSEQLDELRVIGAYINNKEHDESKRKEAINAFNSFYEIATCR